MRFPGRRELPDTYGGARGEEVRSETGRHGVVDDGNTAFPERVAEARRLWLQADAGDFEPLDRRGRRWRDRATGREYKALTGAPLLSAGGEATRGVTCFLVHGGRLWCLRPADFPEELHGATGNVYGQQLTPADPGPELRIH